MKKKTRILLFSSLGLLGLIAIGVVLLFRGESVGPEEGTEIVEQQGKPLESSLLAYIPTDAIALEQCSQNSGPVTSSLPGQDIYTAFSDYSRYVISYHYLGSLSSLLVLDLGKNNRNLPSKAAEAQHKADSAALNWYYYAPQAKSSEHGILLVSPSTNIIESAKLHVVSETSLLDMQSLEGFFDEACKYPRSLLVNTRYLGKIFGPVPFSRRFYGKARNKAIDFLSSLTSWALAVPQEVEEDDTRSFLLYPQPALSQRQEPSYLCAIEAQGGAESRLNEILPSSCRYAVDFVITDLDGFLEQRKLFLDSRGELASFNKSFDALTRRNGHTPSQVLQSLEAKEVAKVVWRGGELLAIRCGKTTAASQPKNNPKYQDLLSTLFGDEFSSVYYNESGKAVKSESCFLINNNWVLIGKSDCIEKFLSVEIKYKKPWPLKAVKAVVVCDNIQLFWTKGEIRLNIIDNAKH